VENLFVYECSTPNDVL